MSGVLSLETCSCISSYYILLYSKTCLQGTLLISQRKCPYMTGVPSSLVLLLCLRIGHCSERVSPDHRVSSHRSVPWRPVLLYYSKPVMRGLLSCRDTFSLSLITGLLYCNNWALSLTTAHGTHSYGMSSNDLLKILLLLFSLRWWWKQPEILL